MTVGELIEKLKEFDQSAKVEVMKPIDCLYGDSLKYEELKEYDFEYYKFNNVLEIGD